MRKTLAFCLTMLLASAACTYGDSIVGQTITATFDFVNSPSNSGYVVSPYLNTSTPTDLLKGQQGLIGQYFWTQKTGSPTLPTNTLGNFYTFCIEITQDIGFNQPPYTYTIDQLSGAPNPGSAGTGPAGTYNAGPMGSDKATEIDELWYQDIANALSSDYNAAVFQVALWKIVYAQPNLNSFSYLYINNNSSLDAAADELLAGLNTTDTSKRAADLYALSSNTAQDQIIEIPGNPGGGIPTPLPSAMLGGAALLGVVFLTRRHPRGSVPGADCVL